ncbi:hypothetical protein HOA59_02495 [archaeon]|mgnify:CR=1 FL=1|jgi:hypothetical protein|nr:hypothetical protein [archaeon]MBT6824281.1 hypothetical protein [archaeon]MBT7107359.1 hypothetical protein [archaeon]MBT7297325.1 hypothetical protein [archaeon]
MEKEISFIHDESAKDAKKLFVEVSKEIDKIRDPKAIFLKRYLIALADAAGPRQLRHVKIEDIKKDKAPEIKPTIRRLERLPLYPQRTTTLPVKTPTKMPDFLAKKPIKTLPVLESKLKKSELPIIKKKINPYKENITPLHKKEEVSEEGIYRIKYSPKNKVFGKIDPLLMDQKIKTIYCNGPNKQILVDTEFEEGLKTNLTFETTKEINNMIKVFAKKSKTKISETNPVLEANLSEKTKVQGIIGSEFVTPKFILKRI